ncbi:MAG: T9SS type A sorting domain-containing protein, partial [Prevotellaceae bacterium]|nr:T9SS type A sorting domain-containing protein [Prevotellaceae bacterium]
EYTAPCGKTEVSLDIKYSDEAEMTLSVDGGDRIGETGIRLMKDVTTVKIKIVSKDGKRNSTHNVHIYRSFQGDGLITRRWQHVLAVNTNPKNNGGYSNIEYFRWYNKDDSAKVISREQSLSITPAKAQSYYVEISIGGKWHRVCNIPESQNVGNIVAYPNPVASGENLTLQLPVEFVDGRMDVISIGGTVMKRNVPLPNMQTDVNFYDLPSGVYMLKIMSINGNSETIKIIIGN